MNNQKRQILRMFKSLEGVIESISSTLMSDKLEDINYFTSKIKKDVKNLKMKESDIYS